MTLRTIRIRAPLELRVCVLFFWGKHTEKRKTESFYLSRERVRVAYSELWWKPEPFVSPLCAPVRMNVYKHRISKKHKALCEDPRIIPTLSAWTRVDKWGGSYILQLCGSELQMIERFSFLFHENTSMWVCLLLTNLLSPGYTDTICSAVIGSGWKAVR